MFIHFSLVIIIITETQMDARATYCWMPFETHVSINVDMCFQRSLLFLSATFASLSLHLDLYDYNGSRFKTLWQTSESLDSVVCSVYKNRMRQKQHRTYSPSSHSPSFHHNLLWSFIVIGTRSCREMHTTNLLQEQ